MLDSTLSLRAVGPATVLSHKCDILSLLKDAQIGRENYLPVHCRHLPSWRHHIVIPVATQMSLPLFAYPLSECSKSRDLIAIAICDSNRESQITSDLRQWGGIWVRPPPRGPPRKPLLRVSVFGSCLRLLCAVLATI